MLSLGAILAQHLFTRVEDRVSETISTARRNAIAGLIIGLMLGTAYVLAVVAACIELSTRYGAVPALLGFAGALLLLSLLVIGIVVLRNRRERELRQLKRNQLAARRDLMAAAATMVTRKPMAATGIALVLGFLLAPKSRPRRDD
jgi:hypothetical protein